MLSSDYIFWRTWQTSCQSQKDPRGWRRSPQEATSPRSFAWSSSFGSTRSAAGVGTSHCQVAPILSFEGRRLRCSLMAASGMGALAATEPLRQGVPSGRRKLTPIGVVIAESLGSCAKLVGKSHESGSAPCRRGPKRWSGESHACLAGSALKGG